MTRRLIHNMILCCAMCLLFTSSVLSAAAMTPTKQDAERLEVLQLGYSLADLCGDAHATHDHRCPFCTLLPEADIPSLPARASLLLPHALWVQAEDLFRAAQARDHARIPRAPPALI